MLGNSNIVARPCLPSGWLWVCMGGMLAAGGMPADQAWSQETIPRFVQELPDSGQGEFYQCDLQRRFSDYELTATQFVARAVDDGCDIVIVAPPRPIDAAPVLSRFLEEVAAAQKAFPKTIILTGYSWAIRAAGVNGRATILIPPGPDFTARYLDLPKQFVKQGSDTTTAQALSKTIQNLCSDDVPVEQWPVIVFDQFRDGTSLHRWSVQHLDQTDRWSQAGQPARPAVGQLGLLDRWDQSDVRSGAGWDLLLADGWNAWAAADDLDLVHETSRGKQGRFSETRIRLPELTAAHALHGLRTGAFYGVRGGLVRDVELSLVADGLPRPAFSGETIDLPVGTPIRVRLSLTVPDVDWKSSPNRVDSVELIAVTPEHSRLVQKTTPHSGHVDIEYETEVPVGGVLFRAIGYRVIKEGSDYSFYTNPIRVLASGRWERPKSEVVRDSWRIEDSTLVIAGLLLGLSLAAVSGWLVATGKMSLLVADIFRPVIRLWQTTNLYRWLLRNMPSVIGRKVDSEETLGTSLTTEESQAILAALIGGSVLLGALTGFLAWPSELMRFELLQGRLSGTVCGAAIGGAMAMFGRIRPSFGAWVWVIALTLNVLVPQAGCERGLASLLAMALLANVASEPLRTGVVRWPAEFSAGVLSGVLGLIIFSAAVAVAAPLPWSSLASVAGPLAAGLWVMFNDRQTRTPLRLLATMFIAVLWFGGRLSQPVAGGAPGVLSALAALGEGIGVGALWFVNQPKRWDAIRLLLVLPACGVVFLALHQWLPFDWQFLLPVAFMMALLLIAAESSFIANVAGGVAAVVLGRILLFEPNSPASWLLGSLAGLAAALAHRSPLRMVLFVAPYVLVGGYLSLVRADLAESRLPIGSYSALAQHAITALRPEASSPSEMLAVTARILSLFSLAALAALAWSVRDPRRIDVFDAAGRTSLAALLFAGVLLLIAAPLPGSILLVLSPPIGLWAAGVLVANPSFDPSSAASLTEAHSWRRWRSRLGIAAAVVAGLLAYGSLVPFQWRDIGWMDAVRGFLDQVQAQHVWTRISSDRLVNILLTVPLAACAYGAMVLGRRGIVPRLWAVIEALQLSLVISMLVEIAQKWSAGRVASVDDVIAQAIGAVIGIVAWIVIGERFVIRWAASDRMQTKEGRWEQVLWVYLLGVLVLSVLPVGMPVTSPKQLYDRVRDGHLSLLPFADGTNWEKLVRDVVVGIVLFIPAGVWAAISWRRPGAPLRSYLAATALGTGFSALITVVRGLCSADSTDSSWLLTGLIGSAIGAAFVHYQASRVFDSYANWKSGFAWWSVCLVFAAIIAGNLLHPLVFDATPEMAAARWKQFFNTPFASFHAGDDWNLIEEVLRKLAWFIALGMLCGQAVCRTTESTTGRIVGGIAAFLLAAGLGAGVEIAQTYQTHRSPEITDVLIYSLGALLGLWIRFGWLNENLIDDLPAATGHSIPATAANPSWVTVLQTTVAVGLLLGLLSGLALLFLRR